MEISSLKDELNKWYDDNCKNGNLAWSYLAKKSGVTASNIRKIAKGEVELPRFDTARKLCESMFPDSADTVATYLKEVYPKEAATWFLGNGERRELPKERFDLTRDFYAFLLFKLAMTGSFKISDLEEIHGKSTVGQRLQMLAEAGLAEANSEGKLVRGEESQYTKNSDPRLLADEFRHCTNHLESKLAADSAGVTKVDRESNRFDYLHLGLNDKGSDALNQLLSQFKQEMYKLYTSSEYVGNIPRFVNIATGRFDEK